MSNAKEIRGKIASIQSTQKITRAMEMVAASKMMRAQARVQAARPYASRIRAIISNLAAGDLEYQHPFTVARPVAQVGYLVVSSDRGLCGGLNNMLFKTVIQTMQTCTSSRPPMICTIGKKAEHFFARINANLTASVPQLSDPPEVKNLIGLIKLLQDAYLNGTIDKVVLVYNEFVNTMTQQPTLETLLPISQTPEADATHHTHWDYLYEPKASYLIDLLLQRYIESIVYQAVVENGACEQAARMVAMKSATENAGELINEFKLKYNKARQAAITQELSEICAGAAAV